MATTLDQQPQSSGTRKYVDFDEFIEYQVNRTRSGIKHTDLLQAGVTVALVVTSYLLAFVVLDHWVIPGGFSYVPRALMLAGIIAFVIGWTTWKIVLPYLKRITALYAAKEIEQTRPELKSSLLTLMDLKRAGRRVQPHIVAAMEKRAAVNLSEMDVEQAVDRRPLMRLTYALFAVVLAICLYTVLSPKSIASSLWRALAPTAGTAVSTRTRIEKVEPGNTTVLARSQLEVMVDVSGEVPPEATLRFTTSDHSFVDEPIVMRDTGEGLKRFRGMLTGPNGRGLLQDLVYHIEAGDARSDDYHVTVQQAPYATVEEVVYEYPRYMKLAARTQPGGEIDAWEGTRVTIRAVTNMPVASGMILYSDTEDTSIKGTEERLELKDPTHLEFTKTLQFLQDGTYEHFYRLQVRTEDGKTDPVPRLYSVKIRRDLPPQLKLLHPSGDVEMPANGVLPFAYEATDPDFMLRSVHAKFEKDEEKLEAFTRRLYEAPPERSHVEGTDQIALDEFHLQPGETLTFWLEAWDNMAPLGGRLGNRVVTPKINITILEPVTPEQARQQRDEQQQEAEQKLAEAQQAPNQQGTEQPGAEPPAGAEQSQPDETNSAEGTETKPPQARDNPPQTNDGSRDDAQTQDQNGAEQGREGTAGAEQNPSAQPTEGDRTQQPNPATEGEPQGTDAQSGGGEGQPQSREGTERRPQPGQRSEQGGEQQPKPSSDPNNRAGDDSALQRLFQEYRDQIEKERREQQQEQQQAGGNDAHRQNSSNADAQDRNSPGGESQSDAQRTGDKNSTSPEASPGTSPRDDHASPSQSNPQQSPQENGTQNSSSSPDQQPMTGESSATGQSPHDMPETERPGTTPGQPNNDNKSKPGENDGPGTTQQPNRNDGNDAEARPGDVPSEGERQPGTRDQQNTGAKPTTGSQGERAQTAEPEKNQAQTGAKPEGEPNSDPATQPTEKPSREGSGRKPNNTGGSQNPGEAHPAPEKNADQSTEPGDRGSSQGDRNQTDRPPARTGEQPSGPDDSDPGDGRRQGQRAEQPSGGEQGSSQQASEGTKGGTQKGPGDASSQAGSQSTASGQTGGKPGVMPGEGSEQQPGGNQAGGGKEGMPREGQDATGGGEQSQGEKPAGGDQQGGGGNQGDDKPGEKPTGSGEQSSSKPNESQSGGGEKSGSQQESGGKESGGKEGGGEQGGGEAGQQGGQQGGGEGGQEGSEGGQGGTPQQGGKASMNGGTASGSNARSGTGGGHDGAQAPTGEGGGGAGATDAAEEAELADKRRATELVLKRLEDELDRGEVSDEMLKDLGWTQDNLRDFMQRLEQRLADTGEDQSPEAQARRNQFQEILRGIDYSSQGETRSGGSGPRNTASGFGAARRPAPAEFRRDQEAFKNRLSRETKGKK